MFIKPVGYKGFNFSNNSEKISYQGVLTYLGGNKLERETCECLWFKRNPEVIEGHEKYYQRDKSKVDFTGFEQISGENVDFNTITISGDDVYQECEYRLYILYNKNTWFFKEIKLTNTANGSRFSTVKTKENEGTFLTLLDR
jgi:hypothetical protein